MPATPPAITHLTLGVSLLLITTGTTHAANLALNKAATGSAACASSEDPSRAFNGSVSGGNSDKFCSLAASKWLQVDLGSAQTINQFVIRHAGAGGESTTFNTKAFKIRTSADGSNWTDQVTVTDNTQSVTNHDVGSIGARYARLEVTTPTQTTDSAARIYEFEVNGASATEQVVQVFDHIPQYGIYRSTDPVYTPPAGVLMWTHGTEYARKLSDAEKSRIGADVAVRITYHAQCDEYDRFGSIFYISVPRGQVPTVSTPRVTLTDFISPFSNAWMGTYATRVYPDASMSPYADAMSNPDRDIWVGISGGSNPYDTDACGQRGITDAAYREVGFKYSLALVSKQPAPNPAGDRDVISLLSRSSETDDNITAATANTGADLGIATLAVNIAGYGPDSGGQEYAKTNVTVRRNGVAIATFNTGVDCASYEVFSPRGNPGIFRNNTTTNPRSWCPGGLIQTRYYDLGQVNGTPQTISLGVSNPSPWSAESQYRASLSIIEH